MIKEGRDHLISHIKKLDPRKIAVLGGGELRVEIFHDILSFLDKLTHGVLFVFVGVEVFDTGCEGLEVVSNAEYLALGHCKLLGGFHGNRAHGFLLRRGLHE